MAKESSVGHYMEKAKGGARVLFNVDGPTSSFRLIDCLDHNDVESYFMIEFGDDTYFFELDIKEAYGLLALYACQDVSESVLVEQLANTILCSE